MNTTKKKLIISTGDISDIDGFFALAEYAKIPDTDVMFIMNYPAYMRDYRHKILSFGEGYNYDIATFIKEHKEEMKDLDLRVSINDYRDHFTGLAIQMCQNVWEQTGTRNKLYFCVGGVNTRNPFSAAFIKNELAVYAKYIKFVSLKEGDVVVLPYKEKDDSLCAKWNINDIDKSHHTLWKCAQILFGKDEVYMDFNGSMAFFTSSWKRVISKLISDEKLKAVVVMGGVYGNGSPPETMSAIDNILNRMSCCTMNQLYSPEKTADFFNMFQTSKGKKVKVYVVSNNEVNKHSKLYGNLPHFLDQNEIRGVKLRSMADNFYESRYKPPKKPFDLFSARALKLLIEQQLSKSHPMMKFYYDKKYGISIVSDKKWNEAKQLYIKGIFSKHPRTQGEQDMDAKKFEAIIKASKSERVAARKAANEASSQAERLELDKKARKLEGEGVFDSFYEEIKTLSGVTSIFEIPVINVTFDDQSQNLKLSSSTQSGGGKNDDIIITKLRRSKERYAKKGREDLARVVQYAISILLKNERDVACAKITRRIAALKDPDSKRVLRGILRSITKVG